MGSFQFDIPDDVHKEFKIKSIKSGKDMKDILIDYLYKYTKVEKRENVYY